MELNPWGNMLGKVIVMATIIKWLCSVATRLRYGFTTIPKRTSRLFLEQCRLVQVATPQTLESDFCGCQLDFLTLACTQLFLLTSLSSRVGYICWSQLARLLVLGLTKIVCWDHMLDSGTVSITHYSF